VIKRQFGAALAFGGVILATRVRRSAAYARTRTIFAYVFGSCFLMGLALPAKATILTYVGNDYTSCSGNYCTGGPYALSIWLNTTLSGSALDNLSFANITSSVTSFNFSDGTGLILNNSANSSDVYISTNASGHITGWLVGACGATCNIQMQTNLNSPSGFQPGADFSETAVSFSGAYGFVSSDPGNWYNGSSISFQGGPIDNPVGLPGNGQYGQVNGSIGGQGSSDFYEFYWPGGLYDAVAAVSSNNPEASYEYELKGRGLDEEGFLNVGDSFQFSAKYYLQAGDYETGIIATSPFDPPFSITFLTPVTGISASVPEPPTVSLIGAGLLSLVYTRRRRKFKCNLTLSSG
jgi:hypothetical protein